MQNLKIEKEYQDHVKESIPHLYHLFCKNFSLSPKKDKEEDYNKRILKIRSFKIIDDISQEKLSIINSNETLIFQEFYSHSLFPENREKKDILYLNYYKDLKEIFTLLKHRAYGHILPDPR